MKKHLLLIFLFFSTTLAIAQSEEILLKFNEKRLKKQETAMIVLGAWAVGNIATGSLLAGKNSGEPKAFHQMNAGWNVVNLAIAGFGYYSAIHADVASLDLYASIHEQHKIQKILLFNAGLDIGYMMGGAYLIERSKNTQGIEKSARMSGFGKSIILQGVFLFAFDVATYLSISSQNGMIKPLLSPEGIGLAIRF